MKKLMVTFLILIVTGCGPSAINVKTSFEQARASYDKLMTINPEPLDTQGYRIYMTKAKSSYDHGDYQDAEKYAEQARQQADNAYTSLEQLKANFKNLLEATRSKMNNLLVPSQYALHTFFSAQSAYQNARYREASSLLEEASKKLDIDTQTDFTKSITVFVPDNLKTRFKNNVPLFSFLGNDFKLHKQIGSIKGPAEVDFVNQFFLNENFSYFHIKSDKLNIDGWVYPQFVVKGKIKEVK